MGFGPEAFCQIRCLHPVWAPHQRHGSLRDSLDVLREDWKVFVCTVAATVVMVAAASRSGRYYLILTREARRIGNAR